MGVSLQGSGGGGGHRGHRSGLQVMEGVGGVDDLQVESGEAEQWGQGSHRRQAVA